MINYQLSNIKNKGFTLIELVVVLGLFMLIMGVTASMFISIVQHQRRILGQQEMLNQVSYVQEYASRLLRGTAVDTVGTCLAQDGVTHKDYTYLLTRFDAQAGFYQGIKFISPEGVCQELFLDGDGVLKEMKNGGTAQALVSSKFKINYARFIINANKNTPRVTMSINIQDPSYENSPEMVIQTTISHRD